MCSIGSPGKPTTPARAKNPSLVDLTSADVPRTATFMVDREKSVRDFARKKRDVLAWALRAGNNPAEYGCSKPPAAAVLAEEPAPTPRRRRRSLGNKDQRDCDVETMVNLEPYRREIVAEQSTTFGHRPLSASRMFNPSTMATSCGRACYHGEQTFGNALSGRARPLKGGGLKGGGRFRKRGGDGLAAALRAGMRESSRSASRASRLSAPMLKELLFGDTRGQRKSAVRGGSSMLLDRGETSTTAFAKTAPAVDSSHIKKAREIFPSMSGIAEEGAQRSATSGDGGSMANGFVEFSRGDGDIVSETSDASGWPWVDIGGEEGGGLRNLDATWLSSSIRNRNGRKMRGGVQGSTMEEMALREILFADTPSWDGTPAPLPAPREVRRALSSMLEPDPDERLRDKLVKSRKIAAGIPVTASSIKDEKDRQAMSVTVASRWEPPPATPRTILAAVEMKRLVKARRQRDEVLARRVRKAELGIFYRKIAGSETRYNDALNEGLKSQGLRRPRCD